MMDRYRMKNIHVNPNKLILGVGNYCSQEYLCISLLKKYILEVDIIVGHILQTIFDGMNCKSNNGKEVCNIIHSPKDSEYQRCMLPKD